MEEGQVIDQKLKKAVSLAFTSGYQLDKEAFSLLKELSKKYKIDKLMESVLDCLIKLPDKPLFITKEIIENNTKEIHQVEKKSVEFVESVRKVFKPLSKEFPSELRILSEPTEYISSGLIVGFGPITINIAADADNAFKVAATKTGFILGPFVFGIE